MKLAYIRKDRYYGYLAFVGLPQNHKNNNSIDKSFYTRLMAERYLKKHGYDLVRHDRKNGLFYIEKHVKIKQEIYIVKGEIKVRTLTPE